MKYKANKSRIETLNFSRAMNPVNMDQVRLDLDTDGISTIYGQTGTNFLKNQSHIMQTNKSMAYYPKTHRPKPTSQIFPNEIAESFLNLPIQSSVKPQSMLNVSYMSTHKANINKTRRKLRQKSKNMNTSQITSNTYSCYPDNFIQYSNGKRYINNSRVRKSILTTDFSVKSEKQRSKNPSTKSTTWNLLNPDLLKSNHKKQFSLVHFGKSVVLDNSKHHVRNKSILELDLNTKSSIDRRCKSKGKKSVMFQYQKIKNLQQLKKSQNYFSRHSKSQIDFGRESNRKTNFYKFNNVNRTLTRKND